jgi:methyl-accepting chemotaxis protein
VQQVSENCSRAVEASPGAAETARGLGAVVEKALTQMHSTISESVTRHGKDRELGRSTDQIRRIAGLTILLIKPTCWLSQCRDRDSTNEQALLG